MIYLDVDGVLADFNGAVYNILKTDKYSASQMWKAINRVFPGGYGWYSSLKPLPDAQLLYSYFRGQQDEELRILTAVGTHISSAEDEKIDWLVRTFGKDVLGRIYTVSAARDKARYADMESLLIDDKEKATIPFMEAGGTTILHKDARTTIQAYEYMKETGRW